MKSKFSFITRREIIVDIDASEMSAPCTEHASTEHLVLTPGIAGIQSVLQEASQSLKLL